MDIMWAIQISTCKGHNSQMNYCKTLKETKTVPWVPLLLAQEEVALFSALSLVPSLEQSPVVNSQTSSKRRRTVTLLARYNISNSRTNYLNLVRKIIKTVIISGRAYY